MTRSSWLPLFLLWLVAVLACGLAAAAPGDPAGPAAPSTYVLAPGACRDLADAIPAPDLADRPGFDAAGRPVAPADLPGSAPLQLPDAFPVGINVYIGSPADLAAGVPAAASAPSRPVPGSFVYPEGQVGEIAVVRTPTGTELYFNGRPLEDPAQRAVRHACFDWQARQPG